MNISKEQIDELNAVITVDIEKNDYEETVDGILKDYRKKANVPGFRKGHVPMGLVKKQYGKAVLVDEVNKMLQDSLNKYLTEEKLDVLGNPLPKEQEEFDWDAENYSFQFELGLAPKFEIDLKGGEAITQYKIVPSEEMISDQIKSIRKQYGKLVSKEVAELDDVLRGTFTNEEKGIDKESTLELESVKEATAKLFVGAKVGDTVSVNSKDLFENTNQLVTVLGIPTEEKDTIEVDVTFEVKEINQQELAELNQELFDKVYGEGTITSEEEFVKRIKEDGEKQFLQHSDQQLLNDITESLLASTTFELPAAFLQKWIQTTGENPLSEDQAKEEYEKSEKGLRYQLIEGKIINDNNLQVTFEELKAHAKELIKGQMAQFGQTDPEDKELDEIAGRILGNKEEVKRISDQLLSQKMLHFFQENANITPKEVSFEEFVKEAYK